jgi:DNA-binding CsgD family transcriptional regulator
LLDGLVVRFTEGYRAAAPVLRDALRQLRREDSAGSGELRWFWLCAHLTRDLFDTEGNRYFAERQVELSRAEGRLVLLPNALCYQAAADITQGRHEEAVAMLEEADAVTNATGASPRRYVEPYLAAWRGAEALTLEHVREGAERASACGDAQALQLVHYSAALLHNSLGQYAAALAAARSATEYEDGIGTHSVALAELVEAAARCGEGEVAADALARLTERTEASGTPLAFGLAARSRALVAAGAVADTWYRTAIAHLERESAPLWLARSRLVYGEWLRRANRRVDARAQLRAALELCTRIRADGFAGRARHELLATGESTGASGPGSLTAHETYIARLAGDGHTNQEIAAQLVISARTVEWHLSKVFAKLGLRSRRQLRNALPHS